MKLNNSKILVIGGAGFVGSHIVDQLIQENTSEIRVFDNFIRGKKDNLNNALTSKKVKVIEGSITDLDALKKAMQGVDYVFLLAALWLGECVSTPRDAVEINVVGTYNVIELAKDLGIKKVIYSSSASVYGDALKIPMTEDHPFNNRTMYGATKIAGEQFFRAFNDMHQLNYVGLRYMNIYGPRMDDKGTYVSVIVKVLRNLDKGEQPVIYGDGSQTYDFVYVEDVARANILALKSDTTDDFFNVGTGIKTSINELVEKLLQFSNSSVKPEYREQEHIFVTHRIGSTEHAQNKISFEAKTSLDEGLKAFVDWYSKNKSQINPTS